MRRIHALRDVGRLFVIGDQYRAAFEINAVVGVVVADVFECVARDVDVVNHGVGGDFTREYDQAGVTQGFGGDARGGVLFQNGVENRIGNLIGYFVWMAFGNGFGSEKVIAAQMVAHGVTFYKNSREIERTLVENENVFSATL